MDCLKEPCPPGLIMSLTPRPPPCPRHWLFRTWVGGGLSQWSSKCWSGATFSTWNNPRNPHFRLSRNCQSHLEMNCLKLRLFSDWSSFFHYSLVTDMWSHDLQVLWRQNLVFGIFFSLSSLELSSLISGRKTPCLPGRLWQFSCVHRHQLLGSWINWEQLGGYVELRWDEVCGPWGSSWKWEWEGDLFSPSTYKWDPGENTGLSPSSQS